MAVAGQFTTVGSKIYDPNGQEFIARGVNVPGQNFWTAHDPTADVSKIADDWQFNMIRVNSQPTVSWSAAGAGINIDNIVNAYTNRGAGKSPVVVMITLHADDVAYLEGQQLADATNWFAGLAAKYKDNPYVWFNLMNEPRNAANTGQPGWDMWTPDGAKWLAMGQTMIKAIRATGNDNMIIMDGTNHGQDQAWDDLGTLNPKHSAVLSYGKQLQSFDGVDYSNIAFDAHLYGEWSSPGAKSRLEQYIQATQAAGLPLIFGEYGATIWNDWTQVAKDALELANKYGIGHAAWHWADAGGWDLTTGTDFSALGTSWEVGGGYLINSPTNPTNLTEFGQMVWNDTHLILPTPEPVSGMTMLVGVAACAMRRRRSA
jgi:hypothetical protein